MLQPPLNKLEENLEGEDDDDDDDYSEDCAELEEEKE